MAESRPWWKLWVSALSDDDLEALSLEDWARWARLGAHVKLHGEHGAMVSRTPHEGLSKVLRTSPHGGPRGSAVYAADRLVKILRRLPGVLVDEITGDRPGIRITFRNWKKYQEDSSAERTRDYRRRLKERDAGSPSHQPPSRDDAPPSPRDAVEEKRREENPPIPRSASPSPNGRLPLPPEAWNTDCPDQPWRQHHCVNAAWAADHPKSGYPARDSAGTPKQCPHHRALQTSADDDVPRP